MSIGGTGSLLRAHRLRRGVTQRQLADLSTVSVRTIRNLEKGSCGRPRTETLQLLAEALRLSAADRAGLLGPASTGRPSARPPEPVDRLIGRQAESDLLTELLWEGNDRFAAVLGLPGSGRTRLALDVAARLQRRGFSVHWQHDDKDAVTGGSGPSLLVLDQVGPDDLRLDRARELLAHPELRVLCTGREAPGVLGERVLRLWPLAVPAAAGAAGESPAFEFMVRQIRQQRPDFVLDPRRSAVVAEVCRRLDGLPTALAEAAQLFALLEPEDVLTEVTERPFDVLGSGGTRLRDALRAERGRLDPVSATVLARLSDCAHDWSAAEVPGLTGLDAGACLQAVRALVERGLVRPAGPAGDRPRFRVLHLLAAVDAVRQTAAVA